MNWKKNVLITAGTLLGLSLLWFLTLSPQLVANWDEDVRVLAKVEISADETELTLNGIRDWTYARDEVLTRDYFSQTYQLEDLQNVWFYWQPLEPTELIAHTFVVFEFDESYGDARHLGLSVETRRKQGQEYSLLKGAFRGFMLVHTWATEHDLVTRRTDYYDYQLTKYKLNLSAADQRGLLKAFARETNQLHEQPRFYNTLTYNCTSTLAHYANQIKPGSIPWHYSFILTGKSVEYLRSLGYIDEPFSRE